MVFQIAYQFFYENQVQDGLESPCTSEINAIFDILFNEVIVTNVDILRSHFETALAEKGITRQMIAALPAATQEAILRMMDAYGQGDREEGFSIAEGEKDRLSQDREGLGMEDYLILSCSIDRIHSVCRALCMKERICPYPLEPVLN